jgi:endonuclease YncB( thermonuclease family)
MFLTRRTSLPAGALVAAAVFALGFGAGAMLTPGLSGVPTAARAAAAAPALVATPATAYQAEVVGVIDGDTFDARVRVWPGIEIVTKIRLREIDAPEFNSRCDAERSGAKAAADALSALLGEGGVTVMQVGLDKYGGRVLASASTRRTADVSAALLQTGLVRSYSGRRASWC